MRLWGEGLAQSIIHGPIRSRSRFSLVRLSRITTVLGGACQLFPFQLFSYRVQYRG
jgi:hypothetical protein